VIRAWWNALPLREQRIVAVGVIVVAAMLGWALIWHPLAMRRAELREAVDAQRRDLAYVRIATAEVDRLRSVSKHSRGDRQGRSLLALADASARAGGLESALRRVEPVGSSSVRVSFEFASFDALIGWIEGLTGDYGIEATDFSADRADGVGLVNARVTLQDAP
jgi:general secretion pathway protein M